MAFQAHQLLPEDKAADAFHSSLLMKAKNYGINPLDGQSYRLLGPAYIHGIMQGEAWEDDECNLQEYQII